MAEHLLSGCFEVSGTAEQIGWLRRANLAAAAFARDPEAKPPPETERPYCYTEARALAKRLRHHRHPGPDPGRPVGPGSWVGVDVRECGTSCKVWSDGRFNFFYVGKLIQLWMRKFDVRRPVGFQWAGHCSPASEAGEGDFHGGSCVVTQARIRHSFSEGSMDLGLEDTAAEAAEGWTPPDRGDGLQAAIEEQEELSRF